MSKVEYCVASVFDSALAISVLFRPINCDYKYNELIVFLVKNEFLSPRS